MFVQKNSVLFNYDYCDYREHSHVSDNLMIFFSIAFIYDDAVVISQPKRRYAKHIRSRERLMNVRKRGKEERYCVKSGKK